MHNRIFMATVVNFCIALIYAAQVFAATGPETRKVPQKGVAAQGVQAGNPAAAATAKPVSPDTTGKPADSVPVQPVVTQYTLKINCDPAGAAVYIDDSLKGEAPLSIAGVAPGKHVLTLKKKGFFLKKAELLVDSSTAKDLSFVLLQPGYLKIETVPPGAELWIDDKREGSTPYETDRIKPGDHTVKVTLGKYAPQEGNVTISNGGRDSLKLVLEYTRAYKEEMAAAQAAQAKEHRERMYLGIVSGLFVIGAIVLVFVEAMGQ